jgi:hypothetical protein
MTNIALKDCIIGVWRDVLTAPQRMPQMFLFAFALTLSALAIVHWFELTISHRDAMHGALAWIAKSRYLKVAFTHIAKIATVVVAVPLIRSSAPGLRRTEVNNLLPYLRYAMIWLVLINIGIVLGFFINQLKHILLLMGASDRSIAATVHTARLMTFAGAMYLAGRLVLVFGHVALGGGFEWRASWQDTRGHFSAIAAVYLGAAVLPIQFTGGVVFPALTSRMSSVPMALIIASFFCLLAIYTGAISIAWMYKCFAGEMIAETWLGMPRSVNPGDQ